jgi:hypothetical protein
LIHGNCHNLEIKDHESKMMKQESLEFGALWNCVPWFKGPNFTGNVCSLKDLASAVGPSGGNQLRLQNFPTHKYVDNRDVQNQDSSACYQLRCRRQLTLPDSLQHQAFAGAITEEIMRQLYVGQDISELVLASLLNNQNKYTES